MEELRLDNVVIVAAAAFVAPLLLGLVPRLPLPSVVVEICAGVALGPSVLGWVRIDAAVEVLALIGLAYLLFLAGLELDLRSLGGRVLGLAGVGFLLSLVLAAACALALGTAGLVEAPLFLAVVLSATALGVVVPLLKDAGEASSPFGQLVIAAASVADFGTVVLLSLLFSAEATSAPARAALLAVFVSLVVVVGVALSRAGRRRALSSALARLQDTTAQIRVRGAFLLLVAFAALASWLGFETILGAFAAGALLGLLDPNRGSSDHLLLRAKLEAAGYGVFVPIFFVASGVGLDLGALFGGAAAVGLVPLLLGVLLIARGLPALLYGALLGRRRTLAAALLQATSLSFLVAAARIGEELGLLDEATAAALVAAGLLSVLLFPATASVLLRRSHKDGGQPLVVGKASPS